eukprot:CAMPEP_0176281466 /NCGR_PEP_ID=MMETSP0121_2-20121125/50309_1 /TAXON_ID=160619 /ORGANISM="Kryptoperidinium foliaceum, Strain CCMP 1326" /LENGTH=46 /DNA_ID= /DNA_START= /DNA_END= /DNA_ORIENTATION=
MAQLFLEPLHLVEGKHRQDALRDAQPQRPFTSLCTARPSATARMLE